MLTSDDMIRLVAGLGLGSGAGMVGTSIVAARTTKGKARAEAADLLVNAAERVGQMNADLSDENRLLRSAINEIQVLVSAGDSVAVLEVIRRLFEDDLSKRRPFSSRRRVRSAGSAGDVVYEG